MSWTRAGGVAAVIGGSMWIVKGTAILVGGEQPPVVFGAAPFFLAVGVFGLGRLLASRPGAPASESLRRAAAIPTYVSLALGAATAVAAVASAGDDMPALFDATLGPGDARSRPVADPARSRRSPHGSPPNAPPGPPVHARRPLRPVDPARRRHVGGERAAARGAHRAAGTGVRRTRRNAQLSRRRSLPSLEAGVDRI